MKSKKIEKTNLFNNFYKDMSYADEDEIYSWLRAHGRDEEVSKSTAYEWWCAEWYEPYLCR